MKLLSYYLEEDASTAYKEHTAQAMWGANQETRKSWPAVVNMLIKRYLTDDVLQDALEEVTRASQRPGEDVEVYAERLARSASACNDVFSPADMTNHFVRGLNESIKTRVQATLKSMPLEQRTDYQNVRQLAILEGRAQRSQAKALKSNFSAGSSVSRGGNKRDNTMMIGNPHQAGCPESVASSVHDPVPAHTHLDDPVSIIDTACHLDHIFLMTSEQAAEHVQGYDLQERNVFGPTTEVPELTKEQMESALSVIPADYWNLSCWSCREGGHSTFTCPHLTWSQRIYFAYKCYLHQIETNPRMKE